MWKWSLLEKVVAQSETAVPLGDERRAMQLFNPGLSGQWSTTGTLIAAVQVLLPGEIAEAHRHTANAFRFIMHGKGASSTVEGERYPMNEGDLVLAADHVTPQAINFMARFGRGVAQGRAGTPDPGPGQL